MLAAVVETSLASSYRRCFGRVPSDYLEAVQEIAKPVKILVVPVIGLVGPMFEQATLLVVADRSLPNDLF